MTEAIKPPKGEPKQFSSQQISTTIKSTLLRLPNGHSPLEIGQNLSGIVLKSSVVGETRIKLDTGEIFLKSNDSLSTGTKIMVRVISGGNKPQVLLQIHPDLPRNSSLPESTTHTAREEYPQVNTGFGRAQLPSSIRYSNNPPPVHLSGLLAKGELFSGQVSGPPQTKTTYTNRSPTPRLGNTENSVSRPALDVSQPQFSLGTSLTIQLMSISQSGGKIKSRLTSNDAPLGSPGTKLVGTVTNSTPDGRPIITTPLATITIDIKSAIPIGTRLTMVVYGSSQPNERSSFAPINPLGNWQSLQDAIQIVRQADPITHSSLIRKIPTAGPQLTASMLLFLYTMKNGGMSRFLGESASQILEAEGNLWKYLQEDVGQAPRQAPERPSSDWRAFLIPFLTHGGIQQFRFNVRPDDESNDGSSETDPVFQFIVEAILGKLGQIQIDGRVQNKIIELIMYSQNTVSDEIRIGINKIYTDTLSALGFAGTLSYRKVESLDEMPKSTAGTSHRGISV
ncbi:MAG: hypothetical protein VX941_11600 [Pseudomonadota bacterium]|nr:hypothetical protein [Pseudomonadota bacterium]